MPTIRVSPTRTPIPSPTVTPTRVVPPPPPISYAGVPVASSTAGWISDSKLWLAVPHRSQFDSTVWAQSNCGPTSLAMIFEAYGLKGYSNEALRGEVNRLQGNSDPNQGTSLSAIAAVAQRAGLYPVGLRSRWTLDDVRTSVRAGRPVILLTHYADLPGNGGYQGDINHYIVLSGLSGDQFIYNDPAYPQGRGAGLLIPAETLRRASADANVPGQGVAFALRADGAGLLQPDRLHGDDPGDEDIELEDEQALIEAAMDDAAVESLVLDQDDVVAYVPGFVDESQLFPAPTPAAPPTLTAPLALSRTPDAASSTSGFPIGRAAAILGLVVLGAYAPGAVAIIIGQIRS